MSAILNKFMLAFPLRNIEEKQAALQNTKRKKISIILENIK